MHDTTWLHGSKPHAWTTADSTVAFVEVVSAPLERIQRAFLLQPFLDARTEGGALALCPLSLKVGVWRSSPPTMMAGAKLNVVGTNVQVTPALREAAEAKLEVPLTRYEPLLTGPTQLTLRVENRGGGLHDEAHKGQEAHVAELTATCKDKQVIRVSSESSDMYASLDLLNDMLSRKLRKHKEKKMEKQREGGHAEAAAILADEAIGDDDEEEAVVPAS